MKNLSVEQIERLYEFTRQHYVEYYDVQTELVDHLASAIEKHWQEDPDQDFETLLQKEFKKFGIFGFTDVVAEREQAMQKRYFQLVKKEALEFLKLPKVFIVAFLVWLFSFLLLQKEIGFVIVGSILVLEIIYVFYSLIKFHKASAHKKKERGGKTYLLEKMFMNMGRGVGGFVISPWQWYWVAEKTLPYQYFAVVFALLITFSFILHYIVFKILPAKKEEILLKAYPEMKLEKV
ncbi:hypothetical protein SAMN04488096_103233 [Mesonia phycicola]|uniref:Uncharacterized protein n=1 Tax=Mesonia phycicola TaxID=579105 RepID=A0A1M6D002_9FLAO|nr:hypothetical protein [Mesonia phycicola]SHI66404.1 hypothetical protein SAMN04488096_103233 [Mesonia phycicola]